MKRTVLCIICFLLISGCGQLLFPELYKYQKEMFQTAKENVTKYSSDEMKEHIANGKIIMGMNEDEVLMSWGSPYPYGDINKTVGFWGTHEQWVYRSFAYELAYAYLYFENGKLTGWQN